MQSLFADLHVHVGYSAEGRPVKMAASPRLTLSGILDECIKRKGIQIVGLVDAVCTPVFHELMAACDRGELIELDQGGLAMRSGELTLILGAELEIQTGGRAAHYLAYFPALEDLARFRSLIAPYVTNLSLSSQVVRLSISKLIHAVDECRGLFLIAHAFTPHKGYFGNVADSLRTHFTEDEIEKLAGIELGLSADTAMADRLAELHRFSYLSNSDAHSLENIAREYNQLQVQEASFSELALAIRAKEGRGIVANYGLEPRLGKYHRTYCPRCESRVPLQPDRACPRCGGQVITGVYDRLLEIANTDHTPPHRVPYVHQIPLRFIPGVGPATLQKLLARFGTHMRVLHEAGEEELAEVVGGPLAKKLLLARSGQVAIREGAGGTYGKFEG